jgi:hypothetical protein
MSEQQNVEQPVENKAPQITLDDIATVERIISIASKRGAFAAEEMSAVGRTYDRIRAFLQHNAPKEEQTEETSEKSAD